MWRLNRKSLSTGVSKRRKTVQAGVCPSMMLSEVMHAVHSSENGNLVLRGWVGPFLVQGAVGWSFFFTKSGSNLVLCVVSAVETKHFDETFVVEERCNCDQMMRYWRAAAYGKLIAQDTWLGPTVPLSTLFCYSRWSQACDHRWSFVTRSMLKSSLLQDAFMCPQTEINHSLGGFFFIWFGNTVVSDSQDEKQQIMSLPSVWNILLSFCFALPFRLWSTLLHQRKMNQRQRSDLASAPSNH